MSLTVSLYCVIGMLWFMCLAGEFYVTFSDDFESSETLMANVFLIPLSFALCIGLFYVPQIAAWLQAGFIN